MDISDIKQLANLSRLKLSDEECVSYAKDMDSILKYVEQVSEAANDTTGIDTSAGDAFIENVLRDDVVTNNSDQYTDSLVKLAPTVNNRHFAVKKILSTGDNS